MIPRHIALVLSLVVALLAPASATFAQHSSFEDDLLAIMHRWAHVKYEIPEGQQADAYEQLADRAAELTRRNPDRAEPRIWEAIVRASHAGAMSGMQSLFSALPQVERARDLLLEAEKIDAEALNGSVYTSLGSLYYQVPGSPLGFGDKAEALRYLKRAVEVSPDGIDANYFMGDYWREQGDFAAAKRYLEHALEAPARPSRPLADQGRRREIRAALAEIAGSPG